MAIFKGDFVQAFSILQLFLQKATLRARVIVLRDLHILIWFWKQFAIDQTFRLLVILRFIRVGAIVNFICFCYLDVIVRCSRPFIDIHAFWLWTALLRLCSCSYTINLNFLVALCLAAFLDENFQDLLRLCLCCCICFEFLFANCLDFRVGFCSFEGWDNAKELMREELAEDKNQYQHHEKDDLVLVRATF